MAKHPVARAQSDSFLSHFPPLVSHPRTLAFAYTHDPNIGRPLAAAPTFRVAFGTSHLTYRIHPH